MGKTAVYARVSTDRQDNDRQLDAARDHLGAEAFQAATIYADVGSGADDDREDLNKLISAIEAGEVDKVVVHELSRISRRLSTTADFIDLCIEHGVELSSINDAFPGVQGDGDIWDELIGKLVAWMMEFELQMIRERVQSGVNRAIQQGKWVGRPPFGFETDSDGYLTIKPEDYLAMQTAIDRARSNPLQSVNSIARACGVPQSTLDRVLKDDDRAALYLAPSEADDRVSEAVDERKAELE